MALLLVLAGLGLLVLGGDVLVRGAVGLASRMGLSPLLIGLTVVGFGTSMPELVTSLQAALVGAPGIAVGNVVGSNTANILLILGVGALIMPVAVARGTFRRDGVALALATLAAFAIVLLGEIGRVAGALLVISLAAYILVCYRSGKSVDGSEPAADMMAAWRALLLALGGIAITILGARLLVTGAIDIARLAGLSEAVIGLSVVAIGTSMPELATTVAAALRRQPDLAFGNVIGSNIFNVLGILGTTALVLPLVVPPEIVRFDIWVMVGATVLLLVFATTGRRVSRVEGGTLVILYVGYLAWLLV